METTKSRISQGISIEPRLLPAAKAKAASKRQSFSAYVCSLIAADVGCELPATVASSEPVAGADQNQKAA